LKEHPELGVEIEKPFRRWPMRNPKASLQKAYCQVIM
jgi:hypothetical protein